MKAGLLSDIAYTEGYVDGAPENYEGDILGYGSRNLFYWGDHRLRAVRGFPAVSGSGARRMYSFGAGLAGLIGASAEGSIYAGNSLSAFYIGSSTDITITGSAITAAASTTLSFRLFSGGVYTGTTYTSGLAAPSAPTLYVKTGGVTGLLKGAISIKVSAVRNSTGAEGNASDSSNVITFNSEQGVLQFNSSTSNGSDRWRIYVTPSGFGSTGPDYLWKEIAEADLTTIDGHTRSYQVNFADADLRAILAPIDFNVPSVGVWAFQLESCHAVVGAYGDSSSGVSVTSPGNAIAVSRVNRPEAFPADFLLWLPAAPTGIMQRASDAFTYIFGKSYLGVCSFTGATPPMAYRTLWAGTGFAAPHNVTIAAGGELYGFSSQRGPIRITSDGETDTVFASKVVKIIEGWTPANVVMGWDSDHTTVAFMHGSIILPFNTVLEKWGAPIDISGSPMSLVGSITSAATNGSSLAFSANNAGTFTAYAFNTGTTGSIWEAYSGWRSGGAPEDLKTVLTLQSSFRHDDATTNPVITTKIYTNYSTASPKKTISTTVTATGPQHMKPAKLNVRNCKSVLLYKSGRSLAAGVGDSGPIRDRLSGTVNQVRK